MPAFSNGLNLPKPKPSLEARLAGQKRKKTVFDDDSDPEDAAPDTQATSKFGGLSKPKSTGSSASTRSAGPPQPPGKGFINLSALHDAKKRAAEAEKIDSSIYDYDNAYDTFSAANKPKSSINTDGSASGPKYVNSLLKSAEVRERDRLRAKEKMLQKEREAEGDEFADKEKFVTGAYKQQQEELRRLEEEEAKREADEELKRQKGGGMRGFYESVLKRDEERAAEIQRATEERAKLGPEQTDTPTDTENKAESEAQIAAELNSRGARIAVNDDGAVVDKRDLLSSGLNVAKKPKPNSLDSLSKSAYPSRTAPSSTSDRFFSSSASSKTSQRGRQTQMLASQIEAMERQQQEQEERERKEAEEKAKSKFSSDKVTGARERYLARKREAEADAAAAAAKKKSPGDN